MQVKFDGSCTGSSSYSCSRCNIKLDSTHWMLNYCQLPWDVGCHDLLGLFILWNCACTCSGSNVPQKRTPALQNILLNNIRLIQLVYFINLILQSSILCHLMSSMKKIVRLTFQCNFVFLLMSQLLYFHQIIRNQKENDQKNQVAKSSAVGSSAPELWNTTCLICTCMKTWSALLLISPMRTTLPVTAFLK